MSKRTKKKRRIEKIQKHKGYWLLIRQFREVYGEAKDEWECKFRIKQFRGTLKDDLLEIKSLIRSKRQDLFLEVARYDSSKDYEFSTSGLIEQIQLIQKLEKVESLLDDKRIYKGLEEEYKIEITIKESYSIVDIQHHLKYESDRLWEEGYRVSEQFLITPKGRNKFTFYDEIGWLHNKGATAIEITYR